MTAGEVFLLILFAILPAICTVGFFFLHTKTKFKNWKGIYKALIIGAVFGLICILSTEFGPSYQKIPLNTRTCAVVSASFIFGWPAGLVAAFIGSLERGLSLLWNSGRAFTEVACTVATAVAGIVAGLLRKFMFDDKTPSPIAGLLCAFVIECFHMLLVFLTNTGELTKALTVIQNVTAPMVIANSLGVFLAILVESLLLHFYGHDDKLFRTSKKKIATSIQINLIFVVLACFLSSMLVTYFIEDSTVKKTSQTTIQENIDDLVTQVNDYSDSKIIEKSDYIAYDIDRSNIAGLNPTTESILATTWEDHKTLNDKCAYWASVYQVTEVHLVNYDGYIYATNVKSVYAFDMKSTEQSKFFHDHLNKTQSSDYHIAQPFGKTGQSTPEEPIYRKYGGTRLGGEGTIDITGFVQVGYSETEYFGEINKVVKDCTYYRRVGSEGRLMIASFDMQIVSDRDGTYTGKKLYDSDVWGESFTGEDTTALTLSKLGTVSTYYICQNVEGYYIVGTMTQNEVHTQLAMTIYLTGFIQVIVYAILVILTYAFIDNVIVRRINRVNKELNQITSGDLNTVVDVTSHVEFQTLSTDINNTVNKLKEYIDEANKRIDQELEIAKQIQMSSLPAPLEVKPNLDLYALMSTAKEVGGDFYDFYYLDDEHIVILIADVSGKGIPAAMFMMKAKTIIKSYVLRGMKPHDAFFAANNELCHENEAEMFVTAWMGIINIKTGDVEFANAGHNAPLFGTQAKHDFHFFKSRPNLVLGGMEGIPYQLGTYKLTSGETIFLYTDGVTEATNANKELFGEDRMLKHLNFCAGLTNHMLIKSLKNEVDKFQGDNQFDDITILGFTYLGTTEMFALNIMSEHKDYEKAYDFFNEKLENRVDATIRKHILVALDEVLANISDYGYKDNPGKINIVATIDENQIIVTVADASPQFNPLAKADPNVSLSAEERQIGGLGIFMVKKLTDDVQYHYVFGRNVLTLFFKKSSEKVVASNPDSTKKE